MKLTEEDIRKLTLSAIQELGSDANPENVKKIVSKSIEKLEVSNVSGENDDKTSGRLILTAFGYNQPGVVASITRALSDANCDIQDISQKIMQDFFTMIMLIDITNSPKDLREIQSQMSSIAEERKIKIYLQHEDVFMYMHRV